MLYFKHNYYRKRAFNTVISLSKTYLCTMSKYENKYYNVQLDGHY